VFRVHGFLFFSLFLFFKIDEASILSKDLPAGFPEAIFGEPSEKKKTHEARRNNTTQPPSVLYAYIRFVHISIAHNAFHFLI